MFICFTRPGVCFDSANKIEVIVATHGARKLPNINEIGQNGFVENDWFEIDFDKQVAFVHSYNGHL